MNLSPEAEHVLIVVVRRTGCTQADVYRAIGVVGPDVERVIGWLRRNMRCA